MNTYQRRELKAWGKAATLVAILGGVLVLLVLVGLKNAGLI